MNQTLPASLLLLAAAFPLLVTAAAAFGPTRRIAMSLAPWAALPTLVHVILVPPGPSLHLPWLLLGSELGVVDNTGRVFLLFTALLWWLAGLYGRAYLAEDPRRNQFFTYFLLSMSGNFGLILAQDMASFYLFFAVMSFASYGLVAHERSGPALHAGNVYIVFVIIGEVLLFTAITLAAAATGSMEFETVRHGLANSEYRDLIMLLAFTGFGIKAGVLGLHVWLPLAHPVAPTPASAVLSGAMIKAGLLGWLRLLPLGEIALAGWGQALLLLGLAAAFYGVLVGITQRDPKTVLAYSSVSKMGVMTVGVGLGLLAPNAWPAILPVVALYALHHGLSKGALFLGVGLNGSHHPPHRRWIWLGLWLPALALIGAPWTSGMYAKLLLKSLAVHALMPWDTLLPGLLSLSAFTTALLMARLLYLVRPGAQASGAVPATGLVLPWSVNLIAVLLLPLWLVPLAPEPRGIKLLVSFLPVAVATVATLAVLRREIFHKVQPLPAGDVLVLWEWGLARLRIVCHEGWSIISAIQPAIAAWLYRSKHEMEMRAWRVLDWCRPVTQVGGWGASITVFVLLGLTLAWLAL